MTKVDLIGFWICTLIRCALFVWAVVLASESLYFAAVIAILIGSSVYWKFDGKWIDGGESKK